MLTGDWLATMNAAIRDVSHALDGRGTNMTTAPDAILASFAYVKGKMPSAQLGGVVGDQAHSFGYHLSRNSLPPSDYSVILPLDKLGDGGRASALDITLPDDQMRIVTARLHDAALAHDTRLRGLREFCGTLDGKHTFPWDLSDNSSEGLDTWDDSHLWHVHLSGYRAYADDKQVWADIAAVVAGQGAPKPGRYLHRKWPSFMGPDDFFGLISGGVHSHGGWLTGERPTIRAIQVRLKALGFPPGNTDGIFGPKTRSAVAAWQRKAMPGTTDFGQVWADDFSRLFTY